MTAVPPRARIAARHRRVSKASPAVPGVAHRGAIGPSPMGDGASTGNSLVTVPISSSAGTWSRRFGRTGLSPSRLEVSSTARMSPVLVSIAGWTLGYWRRRWVPRFLASHSFTGLSRRHRRHGPSSFARELDAGAVREEVERARSACASRGHCATRRSRLRKGMASATCTPVLIPVSRLSRPAVLTGAVRIGGPAAASAMAPPPFASARRLRFVTCSGNRRAVGLDGRRHACRRDQAQAAARSRQVPGPAMGCRACPSAILRGAIRDMNRGTRIRGTRFVARPPLRAVEGQS